MFGSKETVKVAPLLLFAIFDSKAGFWMPPMAFRSRGEALRSFQTAANDKRTNVGLHPHDYSLHEIGTYSQEDGSVQGNKTTENLGLAVQYVDASMAVPN